MSNLNLPQMTNFLLDLLPKTGDILMSYFSSDHLSVRYKSKRDIVTEADLAVDEFLQNNLRSKYPQIPILSEETYSGNFADYQNKKLLWVIDPLDGTTNFSRKLPHFAVSVALVSDKKPLIGVVYQPVYKNLFWANKESDGAFGNGKKLNVSKIDRLEEAVVCSDWSHNLKTHDDTIRIIKKLDGHVRSIKMMGSAVSDLMNLACGKIEAYHHIQLMPWDGAAASLIAEKAGAKVTDTKGGNWNVFTPGLLVANKIIHKKILSLFGRGDGRENFFRRRNLLA